MSNKSKLEQQLPADGRNRRVAAPSETEMARSGALVRKMNDDLFFVEWGNVHFGTTLSGMGDLANDLELFVTRELRERKDRQ